MVEAALASTDRLLDCDWILITTDDVMKEISIEELKRNAGQWVKLASSGEPIIITEDGKPVATVNGVWPIRASTRLPDREDKIRQRSRITVDSSDYLFEMRD